MNIYNLRNGDCIEQMQQMEDNSIDSIVTDPPYELGFMGKKWDSTGIAFNVQVWEQALRILKPGGHLIAFSGSRTYHRMAVAIEDAGFEIRDQIMWIYGSGFPKSLDVSKAIDRQADVEREVVDSYKRSGRSGGILGKETEIIRNITTPTTDKAKQWAGWGTALKPAHEPMVLARKPLIGTVAANVIIYGTGALNIDGSRIEFQSEADKASATPQGKVTVNLVGNIPDVENGGRKELDRPDNSKGRFPANFIHDGIDEDWARYFYCAKASKKDRNAGLENFEAKSIGDKGNGLARICASCGSSTIQGCECPDRTYINPTRANHHPTVKPTDLMRYLVRLITPPNGTVLDPFMGSGSTGKAAMLESFNFIGIELNKDYFDIAKARIKHAQSLTDKFLL